MFEDMYIARGRGGKLMLGLKSDVDAEGCEVFRHIDRHKGGRE